ncbi:diguanylate cyclase (GGDEF)-like protein/PAS domain S-box-containing protein [Anaerosolibacter carboniphilus]|uniref:Diguanylate cyclase (GGDEF)-like protein/PAS domain S-box-containing protein n=2 Tax=Anaerosolibacter carboniphilus TaxID=1417629 RepID=A0A841L1T7_9FIRM|nr:diguanylate cyclase (GGDEF)-like protein/PAS domain S-box-containing protein [Anaerosolibacter carboniphilus]
MMIKKDMKLSHTTNKDRNNCSNIIKFMIKHPFSVVISTVILIVLIEVTGYYMQNYLEKILPFAKVTFDVVIDSIFAIPILMISVYSIRQYLKVSENKMKAEEQYESVVNNIKEVVFQTDSNGLWVFLNPAWAEVTGYSVHESLGRNFIEFVYPEDREKNMALFQPLIKREKEYCRHEIRYLAKGREYCWIEVFARLTLDNAGNIVGTSGTLMDITKRKAMEQELMNKERLLQSVADATAILLTTMEQDQAFNKALEVLGKATMADRAYIFQNHFHSITKKEVVSEKYEWCNKNIEPIIDHPDLHEFSHERQGITRWYDILSSGNAINDHVCDLPVSEREALELKGVKTLVVVPIFVDNAFWGALGFHDCSQNREWTNSEIALLYTAAASIGGAIKRAEDEKQIQRLLRNDLKQTVQSLQNLVYKCKKNDKDEIYFTLFEGKLAEKFGLNTDMVFERKLSDIFREKTLKNIIDYFTNAFKGQMCHFELQYEGKTYYTSLSPIINHTQVVEVVGSAIDITDLKAAEEQIRYMAYYDTLTGLPNRAFFKEQLSFLISYAYRNNRMMAIMFLDLDRFKLINDTLGHAAGDELLKQTSIRLKQVVHEDDMIVRMGGDEFVIVFPEVFEEGNISRLAQKIIDVFREPFNINGHEIYVSTSIGISLYPYDGNDMDSLIKNADTAMYRAKEDGRNNYKFYTENMNKRALERLEMENNLRKALEKKELFIVYQPRINLKTSRLVGAEALLRWKQPTLGLVSPVEFIPVAEETGLIHPIGKWILYSACKQAKKWYDNGYSDFKVSVNISAVQFQKEGLVDIVREVLLETQLTPRMLELEITENTIMQNTERTVETIQELKEMGIEISIDDFGTGFSSLSYIKEFDSDNLKIDKSFIRDIGLSASNESIICAIISMAHSLGMSIIAEGVETIEQLEFLEDSDCDEVQGYLFSKPVSPEEFTALLHNRTIPTNPSNTYVG